MDELRQRELAERERRVNEVMARWQAASLRLGQVRGYSRRSVAIAKLGADSRPRTMG